MLVTSEYHTKTMFIKQVQFCGSLVVQSIELQYSCASISV